MEISEKFEILKFLGRSTKTKNKKSNIKKFFVLETFILSYLKQKGEKFDSIKGEW